MVVAPAPQRISPKKDKCIMSNIKTNHVLVALGIPAAVGALLELAKAILAALTSNKAIFPSPTPPLATFSTDVDALDTAQTATKTKAKGTVAVRDEKRKTVIADLHLLAAYVQQVANLTPDQAASIIESAGMKVRKTGSKTKADLAVKQSIPATVQLVAKATQGAAANEWQYSTDGKTWISAPASTQAKTAIGNLPTGVLVYFRHRPVTKAGPGDWSPIVTMAVS
jgi:hypothetical protein